MADIISPGDQELIAGYLARHGVTRIAQGVTYESLFPEPPKKRQPRAVRAFLAAKTARTAARRELVLARARRGHSPDEIAETMGVKTTLIMKDLNALRKDGHLPPAERKRRNGNARG